MKPLLVVYYSRTGYTRRVAQSLAHAGAADIEELLPLRGYAGQWGYVRAALDALLRRKPALAPLRYRPEEYETVLVGVPVWTGRPAAPVRTFVAEYGSRCRRLAAFCTMGGRGGEAVLDTLADLAGKPLLARLVLNDREIDAGAGLANAPASQGLLQGLAIAARQP
ncbi:flavodoxin [[Empedobacter] haloabium]|uniref:Flavodoxin n=1 Tax=[Empedobacter] haloabium TaxID=592317 RepID=A0ABZ1UFL4_9BURK